MTNSTKTSTSKKRAKLFLAALVAALFALSVFAAMPLGAGNKTAGAKTLLTDFLPAVDTDGVGLTVV